MFVISKEYIGSIVDRIALAHNLVSHEYSIEKFEAVAQNFFGVLVPITLKANEITIELVLKLDRVHKKKKKKKKKIVLKLAPTDERYRVSGAVTLMFAREIYVYSNLLEKYREIQADFDPKLQHLMPKHYYICKDYCSEAIAMENMCAFGYEPFLDSNLDYDHTVLALEVLAKFHALSFILKVKDANMFEEVEKTCVPFTKETNNRFMVVILDRLQKAIDKFNMSKYVGLLKYLKENCVNHVNAAAVSIKQKCICHGDIWKENILYKYGEGHKPMDACLIDYQTVRISSAAFDTLFLITTSTSKSLRGRFENTYYKLLDVYFEKFTKVLHAAGLESRNVYSREMFNDDLKTVAPSCFIIANTAIWLNSGLQEEGHVRSKQVFKTQLEREEAICNYRQRIQDIIEDYVCYGYFGPLDSYLY